MSLIQTKDDEIAFLTNMYEEKVKALMSIDLGSEAFASAFSNELALALRDIRGEYEAIMEATRTQVRTYIITAGTFTYLIIRRSPHGR